MLDKIRTQEQYDAIMQMIEKYITKATRLGGFHALNKKEDQELSRLSMLAYDYEKMKNNISIFKEELIQKAMHPNRIKKLLDNNNI